jgi:hypothetical protein
MYEKIVQQHVRQTDRRTQRYAARLERTEMADCADTKKVAPYDITSCESEASGLTPTEKQISLQQQQDYRTRNRA